MKLLSVDGSRLQLPNHQTIREEFGVHNFGPHADSPRSMAMCSMLYDVLNHVTLDAEIAPYSASERDLLMRHLDKVNTGDMLLLDRGYWSLLCGGDTVFTLPRVVVLRAFVMNHMIHHRGQLSVYLRMQNVALPEIYGPTADSRA